MAKAETLTEEESVALAITAARLNIWRPSYEWLQWAARVTSPAPLDWLSQEIARRQGVLR